MTDEVRQEDIDAANDALHAGISLHYNRALPPLADAFARHASPLRTRIAELEEALGEIVARAPHPERGDGEACHRCRHCGYRWPDHLEERHANHCAYVIARATLNGEKKDG